MAGWLEPAPQPTRNVLWLMPSLCSMPAPPELFSVFQVRASELQLDLHGQIEGIYAAHHFVAKRRDDRR